MPKRIVIIQGHPDAGSRHFGHALADRYQKGASNNGDDERSVEVAKLEFPLLRTKDDVEKGGFLSRFSMVQQGMQWTDHLPFRLGAMPGTLKACLNRRFGQDLCLSAKRQGKWLRRCRDNMPTCPNNGHACVHMPMVIQISQHENLKRNILASCGIVPGSGDSLGSIESMQDRSASKFR
ncbi:hypothetical protein [Nitrospira sp. KM1]|uniref:hypothetical protein n=1 Tax=Nitrospira sp. KM1 TaxID=1936990 RepID=UPI00156796A5|nr:hypothetical protein [Nitrospira sp. KM1]